MKFTTYIAVLEAIAMCGGHAHINGIENLTLIESKEIRRALRSLEDEKFIVRTGRYQRRVTYGVTDKTPEYMNYVTSKLLVSNRNQVNSCILAGKELADA